MSTNINITCNDEETRAALMGLIQKAMLELDTKFIGRFSFRKASKPRAAAAAPSDSSDESDEAPPKPKSNRKKKKTKKTIGG